MTVHLRLKGGNGSKSDSQHCNDGSYHDVVTLHLCLFIGQFIVLHFETLKREEKHKIKLYGTFFNSFIALRKDIFVCVTLV